MSMTHTGSDSVSLSGNLDSGLSLQHESVNYITFNQDLSCIALGLLLGYKIFLCKQLATRCFQQHRDELVGIIEMLYVTLLVAIVGLGEEIGLLPRKLRLINTKRNLTICDLTFPLTILRVKLTKARMVVVLEEQIYIYDIKTMKLLHTIETSPNPLGLATISIYEDPELEDVILAYPSPPKTIIHDLLMAQGIHSNGGVKSVQNNIQLVSQAPNRIGDVIVFNVSSLQPLLVIEAHKLTLAALCLLADGLLLATALDKGTIIRVFSVESGVKLYQFRRGTYPTKIYLLLFLQDNRYVIATSSSETVHIFRLGEEEALANKHKKRGNKKAKLNDYATIKEVDELRLAKKTSKDTNNSDSLPIGKNERDYSRIVSDNVDSDSKMDIDSGNGKKAVEHGAGIIITADDDEDVDGDDDEDDDEDLSDADGDDSDIESTEAVFTGSSIKQRKLSQGSTNLYASISSNVSGSEDHPLKVPKNEPIVDLTRLSMARIIRRSSQTLGRKAAQKMGDFLPLRFSLILEPTRHFASLKINSVGKDVKLIAVMRNELLEDLVPHTYFAAKEGVSASSSPFYNTIMSLEPDNNVVMQLLHIHVITLEGIFYTYGLDPERGGDCILLLQYLLVTETENII